MISAMQNPFEFGRELGSDELVNRTEELALIGSTIATSGKLFVIGPRRFGKTSILKTVSEMEKKKGNIIFRYDAESFPDIEDLVKRIVEDAAKSLKGKVEQTGDEIKKYFKALRPELSFSVTQTKWKTSLGANPAGTSESQVKLLTEGLNGLENLAAAQTDSVKVALILDEFQEIINQGGAAAEKQIRSTIQTHKHTAYIFAGSKTRMLTEMTTDASRPFYRLGKLLFVDKLPRPEFTRFLLDKFTLGDFFPVKTQESEKVQLVHQILDLAEDVPFNVQMLAHALWDKLTGISIGAPETAHLSPALIKSVLETIIRQNDPFYTQVWNKLTAIQKKALIAVREESGTNLQSKQVARKTNVTPSSMRRALESLAAQDILRQEESQGNLRFVFEDPFFAHWIRMFVN